LKGLLAGNVYDYGAQAFIQKHEKGFLNQFDQALNAIEGFVNNFKIIMASSTKISFGLQTI